VMELVRGQRITDYCDENNLSTEARLGLFMQVCHAIQHAHQKGIIHRDIKPSNILVTVVDGEPVPKVIDFGIAKAVGQQLTEKTVFTSFEQFIGTPAYMSPEQAALSGVDVDTRSDIYSLGVLLYELLTGHTPFDPKTLLSAGLDEMRRIIREREPARPSTRLSKLDASEQTTVAKRRQAEPPRLIHQVRGDLDWIVMKCLEKHRARRYETANGVAADLERHLKHEPVTAAAPKALYRVGKFVRRNRLALATATALALLLLAGTVVSAWQAVRATRAESEEKVQRARAEQERSRAEQQRVMAEANEKKAESERGRAEEARAAAERQSYLANIAAAQSSLRIDDAFAARLHLERCPAALRSWEWSYLNACLDRSCMTFPSKASWEAAGLSAFLADGESILLAIDDTPVVWSLATGRRIRALPEQQGGLRLVALSPNGQAMLAAGSDGSSRLLDLDTGRIIHELPRQADAFVSVAFDRTGRQIVTTSGDGTVRVFDVATATEVAAPRKFAGDWFVLDRGGNRLAACRRSGAIRIYDLGSSAEIAALPGHGEQATSVDFSADGKQVAVGYWDKLTKVWELSRGTVVARLRHPHRVRAVAFSPDGGRICTGCGNGTVRLYDAATGDEITVLTGHKSSFRYDVIAVRFSPDGKWIASCSLDGTWKLWDAATEREAITLRGHTWNVQALAVSPGGRTAASASWDTTLKLWDLMTWSELATLHGHTGRVYCVGFSPNGERLASGSDDRTARLWDGRTGKLVATLAGHEGRVVGLAFSRDSGRLFTVGGRTVRMWDAATGVHLSTSPERGSGVTCLDLTPDGRKVFAGYEDKTVSLLDGTTLAVIQTVAAHEGPVVCLAVAPDGGHIATGSTDGTAILWDAATLTRVATLLGGKGGVFRIVFSPDGKRIITAGGDPLERQARPPSANDDFETKLWDAGSGKEIAVLRGHRGSAMCAAFSPDSRRVFTGSEDWMVRLWDASTGMAILSLPGHGRPVFDVVATPDGKAILTASVEATVKMWSTIPYAELYRAKQDALAAGQKQKPDESEQAETRKQPAPPPR
jgi:eukaryotic-like serine/threonine-protein kinase